MTTMRITRIYCDDEGTSHFGETEVELSAIQYAPPSPAIDVSAPWPAARTVFFSIPAGYFGDWHPTPRRQLCFALAGQLEVGTSDGEMRVFVPGDVVLVEDELAPGHTTRAAGDGPASGAFVHLPEEG